MIYDYSLLPNEIKFKIFSCLMKSDLKNVSILNKGFNNSVLEFCNHKYLIELKKISAIIEEIILSTFPEIKFEPFTNYQETYPLEQCKLRFEEKIIHMIITQAASLENAHDACSKLLTVFNDSLQNKNIKKAGVTQSLIDFIEKEDKFRLQAQLSFCQYFIQEGHLNTAFYLLQKMYKNEDRPLNSEQNLKVKILAFDIMVKDKAPGSKLTQQIYKRYPNLRKHSTFIKLLRGDLLITIK